MVITVDAPSSTVMHVCVLRWGAEGREGRGEWGSLHQDLVPLQGWCLFSFFSSLKKGPLFFFRRADVPSSPQTLAGVWLWLDTFKQSMMNRFLIAFKRVTWRLGRAASTLIARWRLEVRARAKVPAKPVKNGLGSMDGEYTEIKKHCLFNKKRKKESICRGLHELQCHFQAAFGYVLERWSLRNLKCRVYVKRPQSRVVRKNGATAY